MKKTVSLILVLTLVFCMATPVFAADEEVRRQIAIETIREKYPDAVISIGEDGAINVFVPNRQVASPSSITVDRFKAEEGGTFTGFFPPPGVIPPEVPVFMAFLPGETARLFRDMRSNNDIFYDIIDTYISYGTNIDAALAHLAVILGYTVSSAAYLTICAAATVTAFNWLDVASMNMAISNGTNGAIEVMRTSMEGMQTNYYFGWDETYVSTSPYEDWDSTWRPEDWSYLF